MMARSRSMTRSRCGLSLMEVLFAIAILGGALAVIQNLIFLGASSASNAKLMSDAQILCDTKMAEISAGILPPESTSGTIIEENPDWVYSVEVTNSDLDGLLLVRMVVQQSPSITSEPKVYQLMRLIPDPNFEPAGQELQ